MMAHTHTARRSIARAWTLAVLTTLGCRGGDAATDDRAAKTTVPARTNSASEVSPRSSWPAGLGEVLLANTGNGRTAAVLVPDSTADVLSTIRGASVVLTGPGGAAGTAAVLAADRADDPECIEWPTARLERDSVSAPWNLAVVRGTAVGVPYRTFDALGTRDSAALVVELRRAASAIPGDTNPTFRGLPITVRDAVMAAVGDSTRLVVAEVSRSVAQEAQPLEERVAFIAERAPDDATWRLMWHARVDGLEETIEATHLVGLLRLSSGEQALVLQRESARGLRFELLVRESDGRWTRRWAGAWSGC